MTGGTSAGGTSSSSAPNPDKKGFDLPQLLVAIAGIVTILVGLATSWLYLTGSVFSERVFSSLGLSRNILELDSKHFIINGYIEISHWVYDALGSRADLIVTIFQVISLIAILVMSTGLAVAAVNKRRIAAGNSPISILFLDVAQIVSGVILLVPLSAFLIFGTALIFYLPEVVGAASAQRYICARYKLVTQSCIASPNENVCYDFSGPKVTGSLIESDKTRSIILSEKGVMLVDNGKLGIVTIHSGSDDKQVKSEISQPKGCLDATEPANYKSAHTPTHRPEPNRSSTRP